jgi:hypothetical protein
MQKRKGKGVGISCAFGETGITFAAPDYCGQPRLIQQPKVFTQSADHGCSPEPGGGGRLRSLCRLPATTVAHRCRSARPATLSTPTEHRLGDLFSESVAAASPGPLQLLLHGLRERAEQPALRPGRVFGAIGAFQRWDPSTAGYDRPLLAATGELPLRKVVKRATLVRKPLESGECRLKSWRESMEILTEAFPVLFGVLLGMTLGRIRRPLESKLMPWALGSVALGGFATLASGEWHVSPVYFVFDIALVMAVSLASAALPYFFNLIVRRI